MGSVLGTEWEMTVVLGGLYGLRRSEILGLRWDNVDMVRGTFDVIEQFPFKVPPGTNEVPEMAPVKAGERTLPITDISRPYFERQHELQARQRELAEMSGQPYYENRLVVCKPDGSPVRPEKVTASFGQLIRHLELPHIRFHDLRHTCATIFGLFYIKNQLELSENRPILL